jgi:hypothetical protein
MKDTIVIGDVHGSTFWKTAIAEHIDCRYVFLGNYLDAKYLKMKTFKIKNYEFI